MVEACLFRAHVFNSTDHCPEARVRRLLDELDSWQTMLDTDTDAQENRTSQKGKIKKSKTTTDLLIAKNPKNPYPIYLLLKKSDRFSENELIDAIEILGDADKKLKSSAQSPKLVLEKAILSICKT